MRRLLFLLCVLFPLIVQGQVNLLPRGISPNGPIFDVEQIGDTLYAGGSFSRVGYYTGGAALFPNGGLIPNMKFPYVKGDVLAIVEDGNGGWYIGGDFEQVGVLNRNNLAHILPTMEVDNAFDPDVSGPVKALSIFNDTIFFGGSFTAVGGNALPYLGAVDGNTKALIAFPANPDGAVNALDIVNGHLLVGGNFNRISGADHPGIALIKTHSAELLPFPALSNNGVNTFFRKGDTLLLGGGFVGELGEYTGKAAFFPDGTDQPAREFPAANGNVEAIFPDGNGGWYIGGSFSKLGDVSKARIAHILPDFSVDPAFDLSLSGTVYAMAAWNDTIMFAGTFTQVNGQPRGRIAGVNTVTNTLLSWNPDADGIVKSLLVRGGDLFVGGSFTSIAGDKQPRLARLNRATGQSIPIPSPTNGEVSTLADFGGSLLAGGSFTGASGHYTGSLATFAGTSDLPDLNGIDINGIVQVIKPDGNGGWYVGGSFTQVNGQSQLRLAHILPDGTLDPAFSFNLNGNVNDLRVFNDTMLVAGTFSKIDNIDHGRLAMIHLATNTVDSWNPDIGGSVNKLLRYNGRLYIGGVFNAVGTQTRNRLAAFSLANLSLLSWDPDANTTVTDLLLYNGNILALGNFSTMGGLPRQNIAELDPVSGIPTALSVTVIGNVNTGAIFNDTLFFGGTFFQVNGTPRSRLAAINLNTGSLNSWDPGASSTVNVMGIWNDTMLIGGNFTTLGGAACNRLGAVSRTTGALLSWNPGPNNQVYAFAKLGNQLLVGGGFVAMQTETRNRILMLDPAFDFAPWDPAPNSTVKVMVPDGGTVLIGGNFTSIGGQSRERLASIDPLTGTVGSWNPGADGEVNQLSVFNDTIMVAGDFTLLGGQPAEYFGAVSKSTGALQSWFLPEPNDEVLAFVKSGAGILAGGTFVAQHSSSRTRLAGINTQTGNLLPLAPNVGGFGPRINAISMWNDTMMVAAGAFNSVNGQSRGNMFSMSLNGNLQAFDPQPNDEVFALMMRGDSLLVGGEFTEVSGLGLEFGAVLDPQTGTPGTWTPGSEWAIRKFHQQGNDLFALGEFTMVQSEEREDGFAMNMRTGKLLPWNPKGGFLTVSGLKADPDRNVIYLFGFDSNTSQHVKAMDPDSGQTLPLLNVTFNGQVNAVDINPKTGDVYIGGSFSQVNGMPQENLVAVDAGGNLLPISLDLDGEIRGMVVWDSLIYLMGKFTEIQGVPRTKAAAIKLNGEVTPWDPQLDVPIFSSLSLIQPQSDRVYLGGNFSGAKGEARSGMAAVDPQTGDPMGWNPRLNGTDRSLMMVKNNRVFVSGNMTEARGTPVENLVSLGAVSGAVSDRIPDIGLHSVFDLAFNDTMMFVAGDFRNLDTRFHPFLAALSFNGETFGSRVETYSPKVGGNNGDVTISVNGNGFEAGTRLALRSPSLGTIFPYDTSIVIYGGNRVEATFDLRGAPLGEYDLVIRIPGDTTMVIQNGFDIVPGTEPEPWADLLSPAFVTARKKEFLYLSYGNTGNIDAHGVPLWIAFSENVEILDMSYRKIEILDSTQIWQDSIPEFVTIDTLLGRPYKANVYSFFIPKIAAGSSKMIRIRTQGAKSGKFFMRAWTTDPMYGSPLKYYVGECLDALIFQIVGFVPFAGCAAGIVDAMLSPGFDLAYDPDFGSSSWWTSYLEGIAGTAIGCGLDFTTGGAGRIAVELVDLILKYKSAGELSEKCFRPEEKEDTEGEYVESCDPNDKTGLRGYGGLGWLTTKRKFPYMIRFENDPQATAPAKLVIIRDTLDPTVFDLSTLEVKGFAIGDTFFVFPAGTRTGTTTVDLRPQEPVLLEVDASLNPVNGELVWTLTGLDTLTLLPLTGALEGFLPPNTDTLSGQGAVFFDILPHDTISTGRTIWNEAEIYFDFNPPILTPPWILTADNHRPESQIDPLPDTVYQSPVTVSWSGTDIGSGIQHVDILMRINGDRWQYAAVAESHSSIEMDVVGGNTYELYTVAFDSALNREVAYPIADETFFVAEGVNVKKEIPPLEAKVFPNPSEGSFFVEVESPAAGIWILSIQDLMGRELLRQTENLPPGQHRIHLRTDLPDGMYLVSYQYGDQMGSERIQIIR